MKTHGIYFVYVGDVLRFMSPQIFSDKDAFEKFVCDVVNTSLTSGVKIWPYWDNTYTNVMTTALIMCYDLKYPSIEEIMTAIPDVPDEKRANELDFFTFRDEIAKLKNESSQLKWYRFIKYLTLMEEIQMIVCQVVSLDDFMNKALYCYINCGFGSVEEFRKIDITEPAETELLNH